MQSSLLHDECYFKGGRTLRADVHTCHIMRIFGLTEYMQSLASYCFSLITMVYISWLKTACAALKFYMVSMGCVSPQTQNLIDFEIFLAHLQTRWSGSWGISEIEIQKGWGYQLLCISEHDLRNRPSSISIMGVIYTETYPTHWHLSNTKKWNDNFLFIRI